MSVGKDKVTIDKFPEMVVNRNFLPILKHAGLIDFDNVFHFQGGKIVKQIKSRSVTRIEIPLGQHSCLFYLKRHFSARAKLTDWIRAFCYRQSLSAGMGEFENICEFRNNNISTVAPVAAGQRKVAPCHYESFLITESFEPYVSLEKIIRNFPWKLEGNSGKDRKGRIVKAIARLAKQMHSAGFNHRDFNATHVLIGPEDDSGNFSLALFDLQRLDRKKWMRFRWIIKMMAELNYSMPFPYFTREDLNQLYLTYKDKKKISLVDRIILFWISKKTEKIRKHTQKIMKYPNIYR